MCSNTARRFTVVRPIINRVNAKGIGITATTVAAVTNGMAKVTTKIADMVKDMVMAKDADMVKDMVMAKATGTVVDTATSNQCATQLMFKRPGFRRGAFFA
jgi:L-serine deaminase